MLSLMESEAFKHLSETYAHAALDIPAFKRRYKRCNLDECQGICCYGGVAPEQAEIPVIKKTVKDHRDFFRKLGLDITDMPFTHTADNQVRTDITPFTYRSPPPHFEHSSCALRDAQGRCSLQLLSASLGHDAWWFKPLTCWLFPISFSNAEDIPLITIHTTTTDPVKSDHYPGYTAFTSCGSEHDDGQEGYIVFQEELKALSLWLKRDLLGEIKNAKSG